MEVGQAIDLPDQEDQDPDHYQQGDEDPRASTHRWSQTVEVAERALIESIERLLPPSGGRVLIGPGDDAAVVWSGPLSCVSVDSVVEGVHFELGLHSPADIGHRALATALSDLAGMGVAASEAYVALILPPSLAEPAALELVAAMVELAGECDTTIAGGDISSGPALSISITVVGHLDADDRPVLRSGARPGDLVGVTGTLGGSAAGLEVLRGGAFDELATDSRTSLIERHLRPRPLLATGLALRLAGASAMLDVSDGLAADARRIAECSGVALRVDLARLPLDAGVTAVSGSGAPELAASGGDDYELLICATPARASDIEEAARTTGTSVTWIGAVEAGEGLLLL
nr:thiamine-phosphate kinase [Thermoleophilaceae bacterium]